ncbi:hypothetical protein LPC27_17235 [Paraclostridium bifermentans]|uniref:hypothetical protein n=1 Tax=Paraclostridium bifermentans TaxID=1490 RepID=UPI001F377179|nr:hypothetical protein [Paraclostridium bifermentans]MCE9677526.1 hypothetical protein [Paraclostridium bifermentans]
MNKEQFNNLAIAEQMAYLNDLLKNTSLTKACDSIGIDRATVRKRFKNNNIVFNKDLNLYVYDVTFKSKKLNTVNTNNTSDTNLGKEPIKKILKPKVNNTNANDLEKRVKALEEQMEALKNTINTSNTDSKVYTDILIHKFNTTNTVSRVFRVYEDIQEDFKKFCKKNGEHKVQDIVSSALKEYMDKYN